MRLCQFGYTGICQRGVVKGVCLSPLPHASSVGTNPHLPAVVRKLPFIGGHLTGLATATPHSLFFGLLMTESFPSLPWSVYQPIPTRGH